MNEQIEKFIDDAGLVAVSEMFESELEKFAQLIVRECIKQARKDENSPAYEAVGRIAEHFGIK